MLQWTGVNILYINLIGASTVIVVIVDPLLQDCREKGLNLIPSGPGAFSRNVSNVWKIKLIAISGRGPDFTAANPVFYQLGSQFTYISKKKKRFFQLIDQSKLWCLELKVIIPTWTEAGAGKSSSSQGSEKWVLCSKWAIHRSKPEGDSSSPIGLERHQVDMDSGDAQCKRKIMNVVFI